MIRNHMNTRTRRCYLSVGIRDVRRSLVTTAKTVRIIRPNDPVMYHSGPGVMETTHSVTLPNGSRTFPATLSGTLTRAGGRIGDWPDEGSVTTTPGRTGEGVVIETSFRRASDRRRSR